MRLLLSIVLAIPLSSPIYGAAVDGAKVHWTSYGTPTGTAKQAVILVHGWTCDESSWDAQVPVLSQKYRVITLDLPGHGKSDPPKDGKFSMTVFARAVEAVRAEAKVDKVVLVGHSMGTPVIREYARLYPKHVVGLVPVDGLLFLSTGGAGRGAPNPAAMTGPDGMKAREAMIRGMFTPATPAAVQQHVLKMMLAPPEATASGAMIATFDTADLNDFVSTVPVLGIYAGKPMADGEALKKAFPNSEYVQVAGTGHFVMMERPEEFNRLLIAFLGKVKY